MNRFEALLPISACGATARRKAMLCLRTTAIIYLTLQNHLCFTHLWVANGGLLAMRRALTKDHPVRRLLTPFVYLTGRGCHSSTF